MTSTMHDSQPATDKDLPAMDGRTDDSLAAELELTRVLREEAQILELLNTVSSAVSAEIELERTVQVVTDAATQLSHAAFGAFFYNVTDDKGESYTLYTLSGVTRESFADFPMPRNTAVFGPTFRGEGIVRSADITADPRYGKNEPYFGMPPGHLPVRSYLAVPVVAPSGDVLGGLFFGHPDSDVFTGRAERIVAAIAMQAGIAIDKARLFRSAKQEIERRKQVEAALRVSEETLESRVAERTAELAASNAQLIAEIEARQKAEGRFQLLVEGVVDYAIYMLDPTGVITNWNAGAQRIKGYPATDVVGRHFSMFFTEEDRISNVPGNALARAAAEGKFDAEGWRVRKDGTRFWASVVLNAIRSSDGTLLGFAKITRDITERRAAMLALQQSQEQLAQSQKMEGIGHLTGGVAHDFNNLLAIIMGNLETMQRMLRDPGASAERLARCLEVAMRGTERGAKLTQRLLAFSRQQPLDPKSIEVGTLIAGMSDLLRRSIGESVAIETVLADDAWHVNVDPNQLEIALLNLAVNARDAMPRGGTMTVETSNAPLEDDASAKQVDVTPGQYLLVTVADNGCGMTPEVAAHVFEPFYTTKDAGHGTGLGLSQVYGFVKQSGGNVRIESKLGQGTVVRIYLPRDRSQSQVTPAPDHVSPTAAGGTGETILMVEDNEELRAHSKQVLLELGYHVFEASAGAAALQILQEHPEIRLLFTDVGLPGGMNGRQLADEARRRHDDLKVLFTTGYAHDAIVHDGRLDAGVQLLAKPFTYASLASKLREVLDASHH